MGKRLIQQARGKGSSTYRSPSHNFYGAARHKKWAKTVIEGTVSSLLKCPGHTTPLAQIVYADGDSCLILAPEGLRVGDTVSANGGEVSIGNTLTLKDIPEGTLVNNLESHPGDGGKFCRSSGTFAKVLSKHDKGVMVMLPSKKKKMFNDGCRAAIGVLAGGGRLDKPFLKAGRRFHKMKARNKLYPKVSGVAQNAVDHPFGKSRSSKKGKPTIAPKNAPPGRKVGKIRPRRTGKKR